MSAHQLEIRKRSGLLAVTCSCLLTRTRLPAGVAAVPYWKRDGDAAPFRSTWKREVIEVRTRWTVAEAVAVHQAWHEANGIEVAA